MMEQPFCHMHGPEHHVMVGSALLAVYKNAGGEIDLPEKVIYKMKTWKLIVLMLCCGMIGVCGKYLYDCFA